MPSTVPVSSNTWTVPDGMRIAEVTVTVPSTDEPIAASAGAVMVVVVGIASTVCATRKRGAAVADRGDDVEPAGRGVGDQGHRDQAVDVGYQREVRQRTRRADRRRVERDDRAGDRVAERVDDAQGITRAPNTVVAIA